MRIRATVLSWAAVCGCGPAAVPSDDDASSGESTRGAAATAMLDASGPQDSGDTSTGNATTVSPTTTTTTDATSEGDDGVDDGPKLDASPPTLGSCGPSDAQQVDLELVTPSGAFAAAYAWWAWDSCCIVDPRLILTEVPELEVVGNTITTPHVVVFVPGDWGDSGAYLGELPITLREGDNGGFSEHETGFVLLEPLDPDVPPAGELPLFSATFAIDADGWSVAGSVTAPYCAAVEVPWCPCE